MNPILLQTVNAITLADELLALEIKGPSIPPSIDVRLLKSELEHVLRLARQVAGLVPPKTTSIPRQSIPRKPHARAKRGSR